MDPGFVLFGIRQQGVPVILRELMHADGFDLRSPTFTIRNVTTELSESRLVSCRTYIYLQLIDQWVVINVMCINSFLVQIKYYRLSSNVATSLGDSTLRTLYWDEMVVGGI
ncbi:unnamed protein product [Schistosoma mattheei]|uniref:Uncharacterized protein n=1 Tax=Schistosoma mattheei TaxID=31246 RepID=A0A3P8F856_9TREM|nr:unnamed protein product [Schistosoma mattheei]